MKQEKWMPVPGWEGFYEVSDKGNVRSVDRLVERVSKLGKLVRYTQKGKVLKKRNHTSGYDYVSFCRNAKSQNKYVHRLVLDAFVGPCPEGMECRHKNGKHKDNRLENLHWGRHIDNAWDKDRHGTLVHGAKSNFTKITEPDVVAMREEYATGRCRQKDLAMKYGITQTAVGLIVRGKNWARAGGPITKCGPGRYPRKT